MIVFFLVDRVTDELLEEINRVHEPQRVFVVEGRGKDMVLIHAWRDEVKDVVDLLRGLDILDVFVVDGAREIQVPVRKIAVKFT